MKSRTDEWRIRSSEDRKKRQLRLIESLCLEPGAKILDVGGCYYYEYFRDRPYVYEMIDIEEDSKYGKGGGYHKHPQGKTFNGRNLPYGNNQYDMVILSYCLHHASQHSLGILLQSKSITKKYILVAEDLTGIDYPREWLRRNFEHEPGGMFRSQTEWETIFDLLDLSIIHRITIRRDDDIDERVYRMNWVLDKTVSAS